jgi:RHS repeat-associated protein
VPGSFTPASAAWFDGNNRMVNAGLGIQYDAAGNLTAIGGFTFGYDAENRLVSSTLNGVTATYAYDGEGRRVKKGAVVLVYDAFGRLAAEYGGVADPVGTEYLTADHLGSTRLVTSATGAERRCLDYLPFGEQTVEGMGSRGACYASANEPRAKFTGKERDQETGLDYFGARYFSGAQGRFTTPDEPLVDQDESDPQSWNLYLYVRNNPLNFTDPTGRKCVQTNNGWADDGTGGGCDKAGVDAEGNIIAQKVQVKGKQGNVVAALGLNTFFALDAAANAWFSPIFGRTSYMQDIPTSTNWTGYAAQAGVFFMPGPGGKSNAATRAGIWTETKTLSRVQNAFKHWRDHRTEFPNLQNAKQYVEAAWDFVTNPPVGVLSKTRANGDVLLYDAASNTFAVKNAQGVPRTMFKPTDGAACFHRQK